jgi:hypothetical protein
MKGRRKIEDEKIKGGLVERILRGAWEEEV